MIELLTLLIFNSLLIVGIYNATDYELDVDLKPTNKNILWWVKWYTRKLPFWFTDPLHGCIMCMASVHGFYLFWIFNSATLSNIPIYIIYTFALSGLNSLIYGKFFK